MPTGRGGSAAEPGAGRPPGARPSSLSRIFREIRREASVSSGNRVAAPALAPDSPAARACSASTTTHWSRSPRTASTTASRPLGLQEIGHGTHHPAEVAGAGAPRASPARPRRGLALRSRRSRASSADCRAASFTRRAARASCASARAASRSRRAPRSRAAPCSGARAGRRPPGAPPPAAAASRQRIGLGARGNQLAGQTVGAAVDLAPASSAPARRVRSARAPATGSARAGETSSAPADR
jgi:hypothetical protein